MVESISDRQHTCMVYRQHTHPTSCIGCYISALSTSMSTIYAHEALIKRVAGIHYTNSVIIVGDGVTRVTDRISVHK